MRKQKVIHKTPGIKKADFILWISLIYFLLPLAVGSVHAQDNTVVLRPLEHIDQKTIVLAMPDLGCDVCNRAMEMFYKDAFSRLGYTFAYNLYPLQRSLAQSNAGRVDGECARVRMPPAVQEKYPNLIQVKEPIWESCVCVYSMNPKTLVNEWGDLKKYRNTVIGFNKGGVHITRMLRQHKHESQTLHSTSNYAQGLRMLVSNRIGIFLGFSVPIDSALKTNEFKHKNIYNVGSLGVLPLYPYLNKKYAHLAQPLASVLKQIKQEHIIDKYVLKAQEDVFGRARKIIISTGFLPHQKTAPDVASTFFNKVANIVTRAFALENYKVSFIFRSRLSAFNMAKDGLVDGTFPWRKTKSRNDYFYFSDSVISADIVFFHLKSRNFDWQHLDDLSRYRAGIVEGMHHEDFFDAGIFTGRLPSLTVKDEPANYKKLLSGEIDYIPEIKESGYNILAEVFSKKTAALFTHHPKPLIRQNFHLILSKQIKENQKVITDFNRGLNLLQKVDTTNVKGFQQSAP